MGDFFNLTMEVKTLVEEHERFRASLNAIRSHDDTDSRCDELELDFEVVGLPQHRLIPVRNIEPITIYISNAETLPVVIVRDDFPIVPHLNVHEDNVRKSLCYSDLGYHEIRHKLNGRFLLTCIENWFRKTSMNQLHRPDQPLEPFFPYVNSHTLCPLTAQLLLAHVDTLEQHTQSHVQLHRLFEEQRRHAFLHLIQSAVQIGLDSGRQEQSGVVGAEVIQIKVDGVLDEPGDTPAAVLRISPLQCRFFLRRQVEGKFLFCTHNWPPFRGLTPIFSLWE